MTVREARGWTLPERGQRSFAARGMTTFLKKALVFWVAMTIVAPRAVGGCGIAET